VSLSVSGPDADAVTGFVAGLDRALERLAPAAEPSPG
jgi:hypothetical protein